MTNVNMFDRASRVFKVSKVFSPLYSSYSSYLSYSYSSYSSYPGTRDPSNPSYKQNSIRESPHDNGSEPRMAWVQDSKFTYELQSYLKLSQGHVKWKIKKRCPIWNQCHAGDSLYMQISIFMTCIVSVHCGCTSCACVWHIVIERIMCMYRLRHKHNTHCNRCTGTRVATCTCTCLKTQAQAQVQSLSEVRGTRHAT